MTYAAGSEEDKLPEELQRRPEAEYIQEIQSGIEAKEAESAQMKLLGFAGAALLIIVLGLVFLRKRKALT